MRKKGLYFIFLLVFLLSAVPVGAADDEIGGSAPLVSDTMVNILKSNLYNIFVVRGIEDNFNRKTNTISFDVGPATAIRSADDGEMMQMRMFANADFVHDYLSAVKINSGNLQNFLLSMDITVHEAYPADQGGCFIGYINEPVNLTAEDNEAVVTTALLVDGSNHIGIYTKQKEADAGQYSVLAHLDKTTNKLILLRLTGQTFIFVNEWYVGQWADAANGFYDHTKDRLIGQFCDKKKGPFQLLYGTAVLSGGDTAYCSFDNLIVRRVTN